MYVVEESGVTDVDPVAATVPTPEIETLSAFSVFQVSLSDWPR
jgi:hypothetical protein